MEYEFKAKELEKKIDELQDAKLELLQKVKEATGVEKANLMDRFLGLNEEQELLEFELLTVQSEIYGDE
jgi:hypothetical protein